MVSDDGLIPPPSLCHDYTTTLVLLSFRIFMCAYPFLWKKRSRNPGIENIYMYNEKQEQAYRRAAPETVARKPIEHSIH